MLSTQFVRTQTTPYQQNVDFQSLFLSLSGLSLTESPTKPVDDAGVLAACLFPSAQNVVFGHSSFFKQNAGRIDLPSPSDVRQEASRQNLVPEQGTGTAVLVPIPPLGLLVKYGPSVCISEAKSQLLLHRLLPKQVPAPEVFGWRKDSGENFIYMALPEGVTLANSWQMLSEDQKADICSQLRDIVKAWRRLRQNNSTRTRIGKSQAPLNPISSVMLTYVQKASTTPHSTTLSSPPSLHQERSKLSQRSTSGSSRPPCNPR